MDTAGSDLLMMCKGGSPVPKSERGTMDNVRSVSENGSQNESSSGGSSVFIVKLGGSVITDKDGYCVGNTSAIHEFGRVIRSRWGDLRGRLIILLGGGSFGSGVTCRYNLQNSSQPWNLPDLSIVTVKMFELLSLVTQAFREQGLPCFPFQASGYITSNHGKPDRIFLEPIKRALAMDLLPVLSGDVIFDSNEKFVVFSSDWMAGLFVDTFAIKRVVMLTDVPGVMDCTFDPPQIVPRITKHNRERVRRYAGPSKKQDSSGGMTNKLEALLSLSALGVEGVICDGRVPALLIPALFDPSPAGTVIDPGTEER